MYVERCECVSGSVHVMKTQMFSKIVSLAWASFSLYVLTQIHTNTATLIHWHLPTRKIYRRQEPHASDGSEVLKKSQHDSTQLASFTTFSHQLLHAHNTLTHSESVRERIQAPKLF